MTPCAAAEFEQMRLFLDEDGCEPLLEEMATQLMPVVEGLDRTAIHLAIM